MDTLADVFDASWEHALYRLGMAYEIVDPVRLGIDINQSDETVYRNEQVAGRTKQSRVDPFIQAVFRL